MSDRDKYRDEDDDDNWRKGKDRRGKSKSSTLERILTPGVTTNNIIKTAATGIILGGTILLMAIFAIAGSRLPGSSYLPLATLAASSISIACVWMFGRPKTEEHYEEEFTKLRSEISKTNATLDHVVNQTKVIDQRLANVEVLESFENRLAKRSIEQQAIRSNASEPIQDQNQPAPQAAQG